MKKPVIVLLVLAVLVLGFLLMHDRAARDSPSGTLFANGGATWSLGAFALGGTNVPLSNLTVKAMPSLPPDTNNPPK